MFALTKTICSRELFMCKIPRFCNLRPVSIGTAEKCEQYVIEAFTENEGDWGYRLIQLQLFVIR